MPYLWSEHEDQTLFERFPGGLDGPGFSEEVLGYQAWRELVERLLGFHPDERIEQRFLIEIADGFFGAVRDIRPTVQPIPRVFISHQRNDTALAMRVAERACDSGLDYWLDVHDPILKAANATIPEHSPVYAILIAAIIEIGLLNATHVVAVQTPNSLHSRWVPYEMGRARDRLLVSSNTGCWLDPGCAISQFEGYVQLCLIAHGGEMELDNWFRAWATGASNCHWSYGPQQPLP